MFSESVLQLICCHCFADSSFAGNLSFQSTADSTFDLSSIGEGVKVSELNALKENIGKCLKDGLFKKLLDLEEVRVCVWEK